ncbi:MAG: hypothetical protein ACPL1G_04550 [Thermodesulfovibrionales bacterium]
MLKKFTFFIFTSFLIILFLFTPSFSEDKKDFQFKKQPEIQQIKPKKPVRIKLRRSADDRYTWEITGDDVDEIIRTDRKIRRMLKIE